jgi:hypothetical protein
MRTWFIFLFRRTLRIRCFNFFNVCENLSKFIVVHLFKNSTKVPFTLPEDASHDFSRRSLPLEFVLPRPPYDPDLAPSEFHLFGRLKGALLPTTRRCQTECMKKSDASAKSFTGPTYSVSRKCGKIMLIVQETLWKNNINFERNVPRE